MHLTCTKALDYNQMEGGRALAAQRKLFNLVEMLDRSLVVVMGYTHESKDVHYEYILDDDVSAHIISDEDFVWQMYMNILCNARKFTTKGHIHTYLSVVKAPWALEGALPKYGEGTDGPADDDEDSTVFPGRVPTQSLPRGGLRCTRRGPAAHAADVVS